MVSLDPTVGSEISKQRPAARGRDMTFALNRYGWVRSLL
jgi:hypothetical protein